MCSAHSFLFLAVKLTHKQNYDASAIDIGNRLLIAAMNKSMNLNRLPITEDLVIVWNTTFSAINAKFNY